MSTQKSDDVAINDRCSICGKALVIVQDCGELWLTCVDCGTANSIGSAPQENPKKVTRRSSRPATRGTSARIAEINEDIETLASAIIVLKDGITRLEAERSELQGE